MRENVAASLAPIKSCSSNHGVSAAWIARCLAAATVLSLAGANATAQQVQFRCENFFDPIGQRQYKLIAQGTAGDCNASGNVTWLQAHNLALVSGYHLAVVHNQAENNFISSIGMQFSTVPQLWIGLSATCACSFVSPNDSCYVWETGVSDNPAFRGWCNNQPDDTTECGDSCDRYVALVPFNGGCWNNTIINSGDCGGRFWGIASRACQNVITSQPSSVSTCPSTLAPFSVSVSGAGPFTYQWQIQTAPGVWATMANDPMPLPCGGGAFAHVSPLNSPTVQVGVHACAGVSQYQIRCIVTNACGSNTSNPATLTFSSADFNGDGDTGTDADIEAFFACLAGNCCPTCGTADFNGDGDTGTDADIEAFFRVLGGGPC